MPVELLVERRAILAESAIGPVGLVGRLLVRRRFVVGGSFTFNIFAERPNDVPRESTQRFSVTASSAAEHFSSSYHQGGQQTRQAKPPTEDDDPEDIPREKMTFRRCRGDKMQRRLGVARDGSRLAVQCGLPDGQTKRMLDVDCLGDQLRRSKTADELTSCLSLIVTPSSVSTAASPESSPSSSISPSSSVSS